LIEYRIGDPITTDQFIDVLRRSTLAERRPVDNLEQMESMLRHADVLVSAWEAEQLIGVARSVTDFSYCCYLSDLAVDRTYQKRGIGRELIRQTRDQLGPGCILILLAAPAAMNYYPGIGFRRHDSAWILLPGDEIT